MYLEPTLHKSYLYNETRGAAKHAACFLLIPSRGPAEGWGCRGSFINTWSIE